jgi:2-dehydropantoate 2-reductase
MEVLLWQKLAANCVCNPLTALYNCTNGSMQQEVSNFDSLREQVVDEVFQVGQAVDPSIEQNLKSPQVLDDFVEITIQDNLENTSSMHRDVQNQLRTEIENLNGYVVRKGRELGIDCPANEYLCHRISELPLK